jgi:phosphoribosylamine---glycine ligase
MNILIIGSGGREHAIAWKVNQSKRCNRLYVAPGNAGTAHFARNLAVKAMDFDGIKNAVLTEKIDFVIVGPDDPLAVGIVDFFRNDTLLKDILILGPTEAAAKLESSKDFAKEFMKRHDIPTAAYKTFSAEEQEEARKYIQQHSLPVVIKADGLAAGKGVAVCGSTEEALSFMEEIWQQKKFGKAGDKIVVEAFLSGIELSVFILTDGKKYILLPEAKDYKRIGEGDTGPNTGGMGSISPVPFANAAFMKKVKEKIIEPTLSGLQKDNIVFQGFIFFGLINVGGEPFVIEYNARLGDPETQVVFPRIKSDIVPQMIQVASGKLEDTHIEITSEHAAAVIAVSGGYPDSYEQDKKIEGLEKVQKSQVFHAGTKKGESGELLTSGGRVLAITSLAESLEDALERSYKNIERVHFDNMYYRKDIGRDLGI